MPRIRRRSVSLDALDDWPETVPPLLRRIYAARGASSTTYAPRLDRHLLPPDSLSGIHTAAALLENALLAQQHIVIVGDFDADGATACAVGVKGLRKLGGRHVSYAVPNRVIHGYGLSPALVETLVPLAPDIIVTVDQGIACHEGVAAAKAYGWTVIITDHHLPGEHLPPADAIVDPNQVNDRFPSKALAGVGVMFYLLLVLRRRLKKRGVIGEASLTELLDLVAVGTVADLVPLDTNNRTLIAAGIRQIRKGRGCLGLQALIEISGRDRQRLTATDIGYTLAPRLNAAGRLEDMAIGIECLLSDDMQTARALAHQLDHINRSRQHAQSEMIDAAEQALAGFSDSGTLPKVIQLFDQTWHPGLVGLIASKLKERLHRPVIAFAPAAPDSTLLRGSVRSIAGFHIRDALARLAALNPDLMCSYGGHAMAAGVTVQADRLSAFFETFGILTDTILNDELLQMELWSDGELTPNEMNYFHAQALRDGGPWGQAFPEPLFDGEFEVIGHSVLKQRHVKMRLRHPGGSTSVDAIHFNGWTGEPPAASSHIVYRLTPDEYRGGDAIQLIIEHRSSTVA